MSQPRKPIPKSQRTVSIESQDPFQGKEGRGAQQNPNSADSRQNSPANYQSTGIKFNRSEQMTFKGDTTKQYSVGIKDIDEAVFYYFNSFSPLRRPHYMYNAIRDFTTNTFMKLQT